MVVLIAIVSLLCVLIGLLLLTRRQKYSRLPPGPKPLPLWGNFHQVKTDRLHLDITEIGKKYGEIFTFYVLTKPMVVLNSIAVIRETLSSSEYADIFSGRLLPFVGQNLFPSDLIANPCIEEVQLLRNIFVKGVRQYKNNLEKVDHHTLMELDVLIDNLRTINGQPVDPSEMITKFAVNIQMMLIAGQRFDPSNDAIRITADVANDVDYILNFKRMLILDVVPFPQTVFRAWAKRCKRVRKNKRYLAETLNSIWQGSREPKNVCMYSMLENYEKRGRITKSCKHGMVLDALQTGVITIKPMILMVLMTMASYLGVQKLIQEETDRVAGRDRLPSSEDIPNCPYTQAVLFEVSRLFSPVALPGPRTTTEDCIYRGYFIPKGTEVTYNVWHVNHDESFWEDPFKFDPSRFLDQDGKVLPPEHEKRQRLLTFGVGKRACVGEVLARDRIFLAVSGILQNFDLKRDPELSFPSPDPREYPYRFNTSPPPYKLCFLPRNL